MQAGVPGNPRGKKAGKVELIETLADVMPFRGIPENIRSDTRPTTHCGDRTLFTIARKRGSSFKVANSGLPSKAK
jgi:hypothetical protein